MMPRHEYSGPPFVASLQKFGCSSLVREGGVGEDNIRHLEKYLGLLDTSEISDRW